MSSSPAVWAALLIRDALDSGIGCVRARNVDCPALLAAGLQGARLAWVSRDRTIMADPDASGPVVRRGPLTVDPVAWAA